MQWNIDEIHIYLRGLDHNLSKNTLYGTKPGGAYMAIFAQGPLFNNFITIIPQSMI